MHSLYTTVRSISINTNVTCPILHSQRCITLTTVLTKEYQKQVFKMMANTLISRGCKYTHTLSQGTELRHIVELLSHQWQMSMCQLKKPLFWLRHECSHWAGYTWVCFTAALQQQCHFNTGKLATPTLTTEGFSSQQTGHTAPIHGQHTEMHEELFVSRIVSLQSSTNGRARKWDYCKA